MPIMKLRAVHMSYRKKLIERFKQFQRRLVRVIQWVLLCISLFLLYFVGFGITRVVMALVARKKLFNRRKKGLESYWRDAKGYQPDAASLTRQS